MGRPTALASIALLAMIVACSANGGLDDAADPGGSGANSSVGPPGGSSTSGGASSGGKANGGSANGGSSAGGASNAGAAGASAGGCGQSEFTITEIAPNVMILLDRSGSMTNAAGSDSRWNVAKKAIEHVTTGFDDKIRFGLSTYSSCLPGGCSAGSIVVPIGDKTASAINGFLANTVDQGSSNGQEQTSGGKIKYLCDSGNPETSTGKSLAALVGVPSLQDPTRPNAVILLTDGAESCTGGCVGACGAQKLLAQNLSVETYVIALGVNASKLDDIAASGGTNQSLSASNQSDLDAAFDKIAAQVASCDYTLTNPPPDANKLYVYFNNDPSGIPQDPNNGWSYDPASDKLSFYGTSCDDLKAGKVTDIDVVYGCPGPTVN